MDLAPYGRMSVMSKLIWSFDQIVWLKAYQLNGHYEEPSLHEYQAICSKSRQS